MSFHKIKIGWCRTPPPDDTWHVFLSGFPQGDMDARPQQLVSVFENNFLFLKIRKKENIFDN